MVETVDRDGVQHFRDAHGEILALVIPADFKYAGVQFLTPNHYSQQLALMKRPALEVIEPHSHRPVKRSTQGTQEVIIMKSGRMRLDLYDREHEYVISYILTGGDVALLVGGGHGFELIEESDFIEVKQGPFVEGDDKDRFAPNYDGRLNIANG